MNNLLNIFQEFGENFVRRIQMPAIIIALSFAIIGVALAVLARRIARVVRKSNIVPDNDAVLISLKAVGLVFLFVAVLIIVFRGV
jgi:hypothetical protein